MECETVQQLLFPEPNLQKIRTITNQKLLFQLFRESMRTGIKNCYMVINICIKNMYDQKYLAKMALISVMKDGTPGFYVEAAEKITDQEVLKKIVRCKTDRDLLKFVVSKIEDQSCLVDVVSKLKSVSRIDPIISSIRDINVLIKLNIVLDKKYKSLVVDRIKFIRKKYQE